MCFHSWKTTVCYCFSLKASGRPKSYFNVHLLLEFILEASKGRFRATIFVITFNCTSYIVVLFW